MRKYAAIQLLLVAHLIGCALMPSPMRAQGASSDDIPSDLDTAWNDVVRGLHQEMEAGGHVGGTLWLARAGNVLKTEHYGFANLDPERRIDDETIFHWASITKTFTGIAIMQLRDQGLLTLDDAAVDYLPILREVHNPYGPMDDITIRMLLNHSAGFRSPTWPWGGDEPWHPHEPTRWSQLAAMMPYTEIHFEPGTDYKYSNPGIIFLGEIIEQLTGDEYETYIDKNIFTPLRMHRSYFDRTPTHLLPHRSNHFTVNAEGDTVAGGLDFNTGITVSNGGLNAPVGDMLNYASFLTGNCERDVCRGILARSSLREMWEPTISKSEPMTVDVGGEEQEWEASVGLIFSTIQRGDVKLVGHSGDQKSFTSFLFVDPDTDVATVGVFNTEGEGVDPSANALRSKLYGQLLVQRIFPLFR